MKTHQHIWRIIVDHTIERGYLDSQSSLPGIACESCTAWGGSRLVPLSREDSVRIASVLPRTRSPISIEQFRLKAQEIHDMGIVCPIASGSMFHGFFPGDTFSPFAWKEAPKSQVEIEPFFRFGNLAFIVHGKKILDQLVRFQRQLKGVWIAVIDGTQDTWAFLIDSERVRLSNDGLNRQSCSLCGRLETPKSPEQKRQLGMLRSSMLRNKTLAQELVPDRDIFVTDYTDSWFVKEPILEVFGDHLRANPSISIEEWSIQS